MASPGRVPLISATFGGGNPKIQGALEMASGKGVNIAKWTILLLLWDSPHFGASAAGTQKNPWSHGNGFRKRNEHCEMDDLAAFVGFLHFGGPRSRKSRKSTGAGNGSGKGADCTKSTNIGLFWGSLHFGGPRGRNPGNRHGPWKWLPEKERTLQNRQLLRFCEFPPFRRSQKPEIQKLTGALEMASGKGADSTKSTTFGLLWGSLHFGCPRAGNPGNPQGPWKWLPEKERTVQNRQILGFSGVPSISAVLEPEIQEIHRGLENGFRKRSGLYKIDKFWAFVGFPPFRLSQSRKSKKSTGPLEMASGKGAGSTKSTKFGLFWGSFLFGGPRSRKSRKSTRAGNGFRKRSGLYKTDNFYAFVGFSSISAVPEAGNPKIHRCHGNGFRKRSGLYKIDNFWAFVGFPPFRLS